jgi:hypothetical protein
MAKVKISVLKANGASTVLEVENGDPQVLADMLADQGIDLQALTRNGGEHDDEPLEDDDVIVEGKSAKGAQ